MNLLRSNNTNIEVNLSFQELKKKHYHRFNLAFALMCIIPFLAFLYLITTQLFSIQIVIGNIGLVVFITFLLAIMGYCIGYSTVHNILNRIISDAEKLNSAYNELKKTQTMLIQSEKLKAVGQLASGLAHEVKNPLGVILQNINYLEEKFSLEEKDISNALISMKKHIERIDKILCTLLDFSRVSKIEIRPHEINSTIENSLGLVQHRIELKNIKIVKELEKDLPKVLVDTIKMEEVFVNVFLNAFQAMPNGGTLFIRSCVTQLDKPGKGIGRRSEDYFEIGERAVVIEVEDTGVGISKENLSRVFEPFFTLKELGKGTGLGLTVTKNIIEMHNGLIEMSSEKGKGTKVTITLKISEVNMEQGVADYIEKKKIMIVDDEEDFLAITKLNLEKTNKYEVLTLSSAKDIISSLHSFKPNIIMLDILMPGIDGLEACDMLNKDPIGSKIPLIVISSLTKETDKLKAYKKGAIDYLTKPIDKATLIDKIEKALQFR